MVRRILVIFILFASALLISNVAAHGDDEEDSTSFRDFFGGFDIMVISNTLHSIGAMLLLAGLILLLVHLHDKRNADAEQVEQRFLGGKAVNRLVLVGLVLNLLGGSMRLFEPGHPLLTEFFANRWVSIMIFKHILVLLSVILSIIAIREQQPLERRWHSARAAIICIIVIGVLGSVASVVGPGV